MGFFRFLLIVIGVFYLVQFLGRLLFRSWMRKAQRNYQQSAGGDPSGGRGRRARNMREGEVEVDARTAPPKQVNEKIGDYVDFEEVQ